jgi:hypothetical protein
MNSYSIDILYVAMTLVVCSAAGTILGLAILQFVDWLCTKPWR